MIDKTIYQPHMGNPVHEKGKKLKLSIRAEIIKVKPAYSEGIYPVVIDARDIESGDVYMNVPIMSNSPYSTELPLKGQLCEIGFSKGREEMPYVIGYFPGNFKKQTKIQSSMPGERRRIDASGNVAVNRENGTQYKRLNGSLEIMVISDES